ncbi:MAG: GTP-binding protein [Planctomycetes bacterium]|nr:GTP-binding protein [Planctomycetota bacterium]
MSQRDITHVCVLTPSGRGAVAVVAVEGNTAVSAAGRFFRAANQRALSDQPVGRIVYGQWVSDPAGSSIGEDLIVCRHTDKSLEIHCHGGRQSSAQIVADLTNAGCTAIDTELWLAREYDCPIAASAHFAMTQATTFRAATILLAQYHGALRGEIEAIVASLENGSITQAVARLECLLQRGELGCHLTEPWCVVIAGQPNVGKSSLINALVGYERAIVFDQPGTTRDVISAATAIDGWPVELSDTAGLHKTTDKIETAGITLARERLAVADLVVWVLDAAAICSFGEDSIWRQATQQAQAVNVSLNSERTQIVINKIDLVADFAADFAKRATTKDPRIIGTCAVTSTGIEQLLATIATRLVPHVPSPGAAVPFTVVQVEALQAALDAAGREEFNTASDILIQLLVLNCS